MTFSHHEKPLLILPCSAAKAPGHLLAHEKYIGTGYWGLVRSFDIHKVMAACTLLVVSAEHGLISACELIHDYDRRLTPERERTLRDSARQRGRLLDWLKGAGQQPAYLACPGAYRRLVEAWGGSRLASRTVHRFPESAGIGVQRQHLKRWLETLIGNYEQGIQRDHGHLFLSLYRSLDGDPPPQLRVNIGDRLFYLDHNRQLAGPAAIARIEEPVNGCYQYWLDGVPEPVSSFNLDYPLRNLFRLSNQGQAK